MQTFPVHDNRAVLHECAAGESVLPGRRSPLASYRGVVETLNARQVQFFIQFEY